MGMTTWELIVSLHQRITKDGKRIAELEAENAELRKQSEILATTRRLVEAGLAESNEMYKAAMALWRAETGRRKQAEEGSGT